MRKIDKDAALAALALAAISTLMLLTFSRQARPAEAGQTLAQCELIGTPATLEARVGSGNRGAMRINGGDGFSEWVPSHVGREDKRVLVVYPYRPDQTFVLDLQGYRTDGEHFPGTFELWDITKPAPVKTKSTFVVCTAKQDGRPA